MSAKAPQERDDEAVCVPIGLDADGACVPPTGAEADALFARVGGRRGTLEDHELFHAAAIQRFCDRVYAGEPVEPWILRLMADGHFAVQMGAEWEESFPLPGRPRPNVRSPRQERNLKRNLDIFREVSNSMRANPQNNIEDAINAAARNHRVSFGTAREAYYQLKKVFPKNWR